jgi:hypothetical protein
MRSKLIVMTALALVLGGCNRPDVDHPKSDYTSSLLSRMTAADIDRVTTPPAPPDYGPVPPDANAADPATSASRAFANSSGEPSLVPPPGSDHSPEGEHLAVLAQDAAARAPDTASADEAKRKVYEDAARGVSALDAQAKESFGTDNNPTTGEPRAAESNSPSPSKFENT